MDSDNSTSEYTTSEGTTTSDSSDDETLETIQACGVRVQVPQGLCDQKDVFDEFFSSHAWNSLSDNARHQLSRLLPTFPEDDDHEKYVTLQRLLNGEVFRFTSPLLDFHKHLKAGHYRPDVAKMRYMIRKAERKEAKNRYRRYRENLESEVLESRRNLLHAVSALRGEPRLHDRTHPYVTSYVNPITYRTKVRYFQELATIKSKVNESGFSSDDNYPEGPPEPITRKQKRHLNGLRSTQPGRLIVSTLSSKSNGLDLEKNVLPDHNPFQLNDDSYKRLLISHKRQKLDDVENPEVNTKGLTISDVINRSKLIYQKPPVVNAGKRRIERKIKSRKKIKKLPQPPPIIANSPEPITKANPFFGISSHSELESDSDSLLDGVLPPNLFKKTDTKNHLKPSIESPEKPASPLLIKSPFNYGKITPATFSDLEGIDMMNLPIDLEDDCMDLLETPRAELMQKTHTNFLSVIRDLICSTPEHRIDYTSLEDKLKLWQENPISTLNDWYSSADNWLHLLRSAVDFLSGSSTEQPQDFVPYIEFKSQLNSYQWIGAGRDSDPSLYTLSKFWLDHRDEVKSLQVNEKDPEVEVVDRSQTPPPPRCPTSWTVRRSDPEEISIYREQERRRYDNPHKAFTFRCNGYESVVGPLKGIYNAAAGSTKARGHTMLNADRPNFVTILSLVRDATARLPNGEGTRADICELLKSSQYIAATAPDNVLQSVVSGALDRMHTQFDPCVKYDPKRKIWIYLHRNRSEEDFERLHQQYQNMGKAPKKIGKSKTPSKPKVSKKDTPSPTLEKKIIGKKANIDAAAAVTPGSSLLLPQINKFAKIENNETQTPSPPKISKQEEKEINDALQSILQTAKSSSPKPNTKSLVKIISPPAQKSIILNSKTDVKPQIPKQSQPAIPQLIVNQKHTNKTIDDQQKQKVPISIHQQILQTITPQQLQNIKNVALIRNVPQKPTISQNSTVSQSPITPITVTRNTETGMQQIRVQQAQLTASQQQQLLQSLKQKVMPVQSSVLAGQPPLLVKHKAPQTKVQSAGTSLLGQSRIAAETVSGKGAVNTNQAPLVAKVLTNAAGQVISVESLLAHQKQHGSLPQGTTLRVSGLKGTPTNIIQLAAAPKQSPVTQLTVGSQNNLIAISNQPKFVLSSQALTNTTSVTTTTKNNPKSIKTPTLTKFSPKIAQQLINAKFITSPNIDNTKLVQSKMIIGQNQTKSVPKGVTMNKSIPIAGNTNTIRMVNAANLNLTHIGGKPVLLASKGGSLQNLQGQNVIIQSQANNPGLVALTTSKSLPVSTQNQSGPQYVLAQQIKVQSQTQQVILGTNLKNSAQSQGQLILGGQPVRLATTSAGTQRVVLASQGQGGQIVAQQILLPAGFQGSAINIKALQGVKVIPIPQSQQTKGVQNRQVFARVMNAPSIVRTVQQATSQEGSDTNTPPTE